MNSWFDSPVNNEDPERSRICTTYNSSPKLKSTPHLSKKWQKVQISRPPDKSLQKQTIVRINFEQRLRNKF